MRQIFINLPVKDNSKARAFYAALGFAHNPQFSDENTTCVVISDTIYVMLLQTERFKDFLAGPMHDPATGTSALLAISCDSREAVDAIHAAALAAGGSAWRDTQDYGFMYGRSFRDPDGHVWEPMWMDPANVQPA
jgi:predicted lactoylglutathione lyase